MPRVHVIATAVLASMIGVFPATAASAGPHPKPKPSTSRAGVPAVPQLDIAISDGRTATARGDQLTYTITVHNLGTTDARELRISQSLPTGLTLVSSHPGGTANAGSVSWTVNLKPGQESTVATVGHVGSTPRDLLRLATVACATAQGDRKPLVCATHSDLLPAGAGPTKLSRPTSHRIWFGAGAAILVLAGLAGFIRTRRRSRSTPSDARRSRTVGI